MLDRASQSTSVSLAHLTVALALAGCGPAPSPAAPLTNEPFSGNPRPDATPVQPATESPPSDESSAQLPERAVKIALFDCFSLEETKRSESLRAWASGGPEGSAWNADGAPLRCEVRLSATCPGPATMRIAGNHRTLSEREVAVEVGENAFVVELALESWEPTLGESHDRAPVSIPYQTILLSVSGFLACTTDYGIVNHAYADAFLAGFSGGE